MHSFLSILLPLFSFVDFTISQDLTNSLFCIVCTQGSSGCNKALYLAVVEENENKNFRGFHFQRNLLQIKVHIWFFSNITCIQDILDEFHTLLKKWICFTALRLSVVLSMTRYGYENVNDDGTVKVFRFQILKKKLCTYPVENKTISKHSVLKLCTLLF